MHRWATRLVALIAVASAGAGWSSAGPAGADAPLAQRLAVLTSTTGAFAQPTPRSMRVARVAARRPLTGAPTALPVVAAATRGGLGWLQVQLPGRPNGHTGWIRASSTRSRATSWRLEVDLGARRLMVYDGATLVRSVKAVIGKRSTPTPVGSFFVEELIALGPNAPGAPFALALSARSTVLQRFAGGPGQIAVHGLDNVGGRPGTAVSHGCIRVDNATMRWLVHRVRTGTPITIRASASPRPLTPRDEPT